MDGQRAFQLGFDFLTSKPIVLEPCWTIKSLPLTPD